MSFLKSSVMKKDELMNEWIKKPNVTAGYRPGGNYWNYYPGAVCLGKVTKLFGDELPVDLL